MSSGYVYLVLELVLVFVGPLYDGESGKAFDDPAHQLVR